MGRSRKPIPFFTGSSLRFDEPVAQQRVNRCFDVVNGDAGHSFLCDAIEHGCIFSCRVVGGWFNLSLKRAGSKGMLWMDFLALTFFLHFKAQCVAMKGSKAGLLRALTSSRRPVFNSL